MGLPVPNAAPTIFSAEQLQRLVTETLPADAQPGEKVVVGTLDKHGAQVVASFKNRAAQVGGLHWELQAAARHDWDGANSIGTRLLLRW